jgi:hypothetical protein
MKKSMSNFLGKTLSFFMGVISFAYFQIWMENHQWLFFFGFCWISIAWLIFSISIAIDDKKEEDKKKK